MIYRGTLVSSYKVSSLFSVFIKLNTSSFLFLFCSRGWKERTIGGWAHNPGGTPEWVGVWEVRAPIPTVSEEVRRLTLEGGSQRSLFAFIGDHAQETYELWSDVTLAVMTKGRLVDFFFFLWTYFWIAMDLWICGRLKWPYLIERHVELAVTLKNKTLKGGVKKGKT